MRLNKTDFVEGLVDLINDVNNHFNKTITMIEVGSYIGESTLLFNNGLKPLELHCVDMWGVTDKYTESEISQAENIFDMITCHNGNIIKHKSHSRDKNLDIPKVEFVYIDASHKYDDVKADIQFYLPYIKKDGIISGHDYSNKFEGVIRAVKECFPNSEIKTYKDTSWLVKL